MKFQRSSHTCGPVAIVNACRAMGRKVTEREVRKHTGTTKREGTTEHGLKNAIERLGYEPHDLRNPKVSAFATLHHFVSGGEPVILSVEEGRHWVTAVGVVGERVVVFDSWRAKWNMDEAGVWVLDEKQLMRWWIPEEDTKTYYGIIVSKPE